MSTPSSTTVNFHRSSYSEESISSDGSVALASQQKATSPESAKSLFHFFSFKKGITTLFSFQFEIFNLKFLCKSYTSNIFRFTKLFLNLP